MPILHAKLPNPRGIARTALAVAGLLLAAAPSWAAEPTGEWLVVDGVAKVKIENCNDKLWGVISWEKFPGGTDQNNPDPAKRTRSTLGMPILLGMKQSAENRWDGEIYNPENGKNYTANISLASPDVLRVQGCVLGFLCGGQDWTRVPAPKGGKSAAAGNSKAAGTTGTARAAADPAKDVCSAPDIVAASQQRGGGSGGFR